MLTTPSHKPTSYNAGLACESAALLGDMPLPSKRCRSVVGPWLGLPGSISLALGHALPGRLPMTRLFARLPLVMGLSRLQCWTTLTSCRRDSASPCVGRPGLTLWGEPGKLPHTRAPPWLENTSAREYAAPAWRARQKERRCETRGVFCAHVPNMFDLVASPQRKRSVFGCSVGQCLCLLRDCVAAAPRTLIGCMVQQYTTPQAVVLKCYLWLSCTALVVMLAQTRMNTHGVARISYTA